MRCRAIEPGADVPLLVEVRQILQGALGPDRPIARIEARPSPYTSSYRLEILDVELEGGRRLELLLKSYGLAGLTDLGRRAKPVEVLDPLRPIEVHRTVLADGSLGTPRCYGAVAAPTGDRHWLLLEAVEGLRLSHVGDFGTWQRAAAWAARFHARFPEEAPSVIELERPLSQDAAWWRHWMARALARVERADPPAVRDGFVRLADRHERVIERLRALPRSLLHGEFCADNILVSGAGPDQRICPVDWEMTARGPALLDLAALVGGRWSDDERRELALAYREAMPPPRPEVERFLQDLDVCRLQWAIQWTGWFDGHRPPPWQDQDWAMEALTLGERLGL